jgi:putative transcriptional regulator
VTTAGSFLVATPVIASPPFARAVLLMLEHDDSGAVGVILNAATVIPVGEHLPEIVDLVVDPQTVFVGGPVSADTAILLGRSGTADFLRPTVLGNIGLLEVDGIPDDLDALRVYAGYSGWSPWQLEAEIEDGSWWVLPADRELIFAPDTAGMWEKVVAKAPGAIPLHRTFPHDLSAN